MSTTWSGGSSPGGSSPGAARPGVLDGIRQEGVEPVLIDFGELMFLEARQQKEVREGVPG
jgi:hypothetical protein